VTDGRAAPDRPLPPSLPTRREIGEHCRYAVMNERLL
jgi:hypothetical protein